VPSSQLNHIFDCCKKGKTQEILNALSEIEDTDLVDDRNNTLLCLSLKHGHWQTFSALIDSRFSFETNKPLLISACQFHKDDIQGIELVLQIDENIDIANSQKRTALMTASLLGHINKSQKLIELGASCNCTDQDGNTALIEAVQSKNKNLVDLILHQHPKVDHCNRFKETALIIAIKQKSPSEDIIKLLLKADADPELTDVNQKSTWLIAKQKHPKIARLIEKHLNSINQIELPFFSNENNATSTGTKQVPSIESLNNVADIEEDRKIDEIKPDKIEPKISLNTIDLDTIDSTNKEDEQPKPFIFTQKKAKKTNKQEWFHAAKIGNLGGLNRMLVEGIDINCLDEKGCTALIRACGHSRRAVVSFLLQQNADIETRSDNGSTALSSSIIGNCRRVAGLLLDNNANPNGFGPSDYSYATIAAAQWNDAMLSILYRNGSDIFIINQGNQNLIHIAACAAEFYKNINNAKTTIQFLIDHGMDINATDDNGNSPLMILCGIHKSQYQVDDRDIASIVYALIKMGAAAAQTNREGQSALDAAKSHKLQQTKGVLMNALSWHDV
jgi:ankyrin repeat protein